MPITADWLFQNHTAQQVTIQLLACALSSSAYQSSPFFLFYLST